MEAIILAAGLGTRLRPLTNKCPKALVEINGQTLLEININKLIAEGAKRIVVNVHYFGDMVIEYVSRRSWDAEIVVSDERSMLLDTGAGVKRASALLSGKEPIVVYNVDILSHFRINDMIVKHIATGSSATLAVSCRDTRRQFLFTQDGILCGWRNRETGETLYPSENSGGQVLGQQNYQEYAFSGVWIVEPSLLEQLPSADHPYPIVPELLRKTISHKIISYIHRPEDWLDVGTPEKLDKASQFLLHKRN